jgi:uncharacterized damage-inducible protein DinB
MTTTPLTDSGSSTLNGERADLLETMRKHRALLRHTVQGLTDEQAASRPTVSELCLGGLIKHVTAVERNWTSFIVDGPTARPDVDWAAIDWSDPPAAVREHQAGFRMVEGETLAALLAAYDEEAAATDALVETTDLDARRPLPAAPWFEPGASWSARRVFVHIVAETAQHAGHADILRETIDGQKSMG